MSTKIAWLFWILAGLLLLAFIGNPPVQRTQEARVVETARQMLGHGFHDWMVPYLNGQPRLQKPPLTYWMAAAGFEVGGVTDLAGRLLFGLCGVGSLATCFVLARHLFDRRVAILSTAMLLSSYLFFRYTRLAETDGPAALFVTLAIAAITAAASLAPSRKQTLLFHLAAVGMALAGLSKGPPLFFPIIYVVFASIALRSNLIWRFIRSGALITLLLIVLPWYIYIIGSFGLTMFRFELMNTVEGGDHGGDFFSYIPWLFLGLLPWTGFTLLALIGLGQSLYRGAPRELKLLTAWILAIAVPLLLTGNKQIHYLLPLIPPLMVMTGWFVSLTLFSGEKHVAGLGRAAVIFTAAASMVAGVAGAIYLHRKYADVPAGYQAIPAMIVLGGVIALVLQARSLQRGLVALIATFAVIMPLGTGLLASRLASHDPRQVSAEIRQRFGYAPLVFYGPNLSLSLCYNLRQTIPVTDSGDALLSMQQRQPTLVAIAQEKSGRTPAAPPPPFVADGLPLVTDDQVFTFYRVP